MGRPAVRYLVERSGRFWCRVVVPAELRKALKATELRTPLGPDRRIALEKLPRASADILDRIAAARRVLSGTKPERITRPLSDHEIAQAHYAESLAFDDELRNVDHRFSGGFVDEDYVRALRDAVAGSATNEGLQGTVGHILAKFHRRGNIALKPGTAEWRRMARTLAAIELESLSRTAERDEGDFTGTPTHPLLTTPVEHPAEASVSIMALLDAYLRELAASGKGSEARRRWTPCFEKFVAFLGHDDANRVTKQKVVEWKDHLLGTLSAKTVRDTNLASLRAVFAWAHENARITSNPTATVRVKLKKATRSREKGFTAGEAQAVLKAARDYTPAPADNPANRETAPTTAAKRWAPWLCALTGARVAEITQLRREDVQERDGVPYLRLTPDAGSIKTGHYRDVPLHPQLVELGFLSFVAASKPGPLFYVTRPNRTGQQHASKHAANRVSTWLRSLGIIGSEVDPSHGWRHRFKTIGRELGCDPRVVDAIQGHAARTAGDDYGDVTLKAKAAVITKIPAYQLN